jgi:hypothetical protein
MTGQMCWLPRFGQGGELALHLRVEPHHPWAIYTSMPKFCAPEYNVPRGSKGWATCQRLIKQGWTVVPTEQAKNASRPYSQVR